MPLLRFAHSMTMISQTKAVMFGGATGGGKFCIRGDTYCFDLPSRTWVELSGKKSDKIIERGMPPSPRAAHAATKVDSLQLVVYGGATGGKSDFFDSITSLIGGSLTTDDLYLLDMQQG